MKVSNFSEYTLAAPRYEDVAAEYDALRGQLRPESSEEEWFAAVSAWDKVQRRLYDWIAVTEIRFNQDTRNADYKAAKEACDAMRPKLTDLDVGMKRQLLGSPFRDAIADRFGSHLLDLWRCDIASFDPAIEDDLVRQSKLTSEYVELLASARFDFRGESLTLSQMGKFSEHPERKVRLDAATTCSSWYSAQQDRLDEIFQELTLLRHGMAKKLGFENFVGLGYQRMQRVGYGREDVANYRAQIRDHVVPLCLDLKKKQASAIGVDTLMAWDEALHDPRGNPTPRGDHDWLVERASEMFRSLGGGLDDFFEEMRRRNLMDLKSRDGKAGGGFCDHLPEFGMPFIYANFNGTKGDVEVFTHEMGHAFQAFCSRGVPFVELTWPTSDAAEIHSMALEFLTWPEMERFFADEADRFRKVHLTASLEFLPYGVAVDHFQHLVYERPEASVRERNEMWHEVEAMYLPWRQYGDLAYEASGRLWQKKQHIYCWPFYYIDYTLALTCALQFWQRSQQDPAGALESYVTLCHRGGEAPFQELARSAGLKSPFEPGCLVEVVEAARQQL